MPANSQMQSVLDEIASITPAPPETLAPEAARRGPKAVDGVKKLIAKRGEDLAPQSIDRVEDITIPGPGGDIKARIYAPARAEALPIVVYWHGGGWVFADLETYDATPRALAGGAGCIVVSCHYRQAPENPFPAPVEDAFAAYEWVRAHASEIGGDPARIAVAGESAGGNLATVVSLMAKEQGVEMPLFQLLVYPVVNHDFATPSMMQFEDAKPLNTPLMRWFWDKYLTRPEDAANPMASPLRATDLAGMPPTLMILAEIDPLRSEGEMYADRLRQAGVAVDLRVYPGVTHEFFGMGAVLDEALDAEMLAVEALTRAFGEPTPMKPSLSVGMDVVTSDGESMGKVKMVRPGDFLVDRSMKRDVYVPLGAVSSSDAMVRLDVAEDEVGSLNWTSPVS